MKFIFKMEQVLITVTSVLCTILVIKLLYSLRTILPWRVNCWFCNCNFWVKICDRNSWTCPKCDQYNGFTKDGDYNKPICTTNEQTLKTPKTFHSSPPKNGLCKMCNINQQLKVAQLANFVPMNERNFEEEIECYRMQLEKAYRLCSPCKRTLQMKLHKEKEVLLGTKLLEARTPEKKSQKQETKNRKLQSFINTTSKYVAAILMILVSIELYTNVVKNQNLLITLTNSKDIMFSLLERIVSIIKTKILLTFPMLEKYFFNLHEVIHFDKWPNYIDLTSVKATDYNKITQEGLGGFVCLLQIIGHAGNINNLKSTVATDLLWSVFVSMVIAHHSIAVDPTLVSLVKLLSTMAVLLVYRSLKGKTEIKRLPRSPKKIKQTINRAKNSTFNEEDYSMETDDDVSLSQFGLHNFSESSNETSSLLNNTMTNGRSFTPRTDNSIWSKPKLNSTFCVNSAFKCPSSVSETVFAKPIHQKLIRESSFKQFQKLNKDDSDSDLDESISSLCISSPKKSKGGASIFSLRKFTATPNFVAPTPLTGSRPLISPSKLGHSTSWVAGGYWGSEGERQNFNVNGSRSSSQSSGFESQASSANQRNIFSQPSSREESVCGESDRASTLLDRFQSCSTNGYGNFQNVQSGSYQSSQNGFHQPQNFSRVSSPVFPQMQYNSHVQIPQPRFAQHTVPNVFTPQYGHSMFKTPGGSGLIKLPQMNSFES